MSVCEKIKELIIECDWWNSGVVSNEHMTPSCSIEEIAEYLDQHLGGNSGEI